MHVPPPSPEQPATTNEHAEPRHEPILYDASASLEPILSRRVGIIGYGSQGRAQAQNLRDSGCTVRVGLHAESASRTTAEDDGFLVMPTAEACAWADLIAVMLPDQLHGEVYRRSIAPQVVAGDALLFAHGFSLLYGEIMPPNDVDVLLVAPVGPGQMVRSLFQNGSGVPAVFAVHNDATGTGRALALSYAKALGCTRTGVIPTTVAEETETDLFGEQAVLCGGLSHLLEAGYTTLVEAGYRRELAYFECVHQIKLIVDLIYQSGVAGMRRHISDTAEFGDLVAGPIIIDEHVLESMRAVLHTIQSGEFARQWMREYRTGLPHLSEQRREGENAEMEVVGRELRSLMRRNVPHSRDVRGAAVEANQQVVNEAGRAKDGGDGDHSV
jgi:ketol-acid reductoisomerase